MSALRSAFILVLSLGSTAALADEITCESHGGRAEACGTVDPGSSVQLIQQISSSPCIEGSTWGADNDSIWVSGGCRAVFDVQPRYSSRTDTYYHNDSGYDRPRSGRSYARDETGRRIANNACVNRITSEQPFGYDEISTNDVRRVSDDLFVVDMNTPKGPVSCSVDRSGTVRTLDYQ
jgi:hypothetical protein